MNNLSIIRLLFLFVGFAIVTQTANAQLEKSWPNWATEDGTQFVGDEYTQTTATNFVEYQYAGTDFSMGFYSQNNALTGTSGFRYGMDYVGASSALFLYFNGSIASVLNVSLNTNDVMQIKYSNGRFTVIRNGLELNFANYTTFSYLYPYFKDDNASGEELKMSVHKELPANVSPTWIPYSSYRLAANVLERGNDGAIEFAYNGSSSLIQARFQTAKNIGYGSYCLARFYIYPSNRILRMYYRNVTPGGHLQSASWSSTSITLSTHEFYVGAKIRMAREGSNIVYYVNGEEKKRINTDANIDLHPMILSYFTTQENLAKVTFAERGGVCSNYYNSKGSYVSSSSGLTYYGTPSQDSDWNHITSRTYDGEGEQVCHLLGETRTYYDELGQEVQVQSRDVVTDKVWATATLFDSYGRAGITTLAAPTGDDNIQYQPNFFRDTDGQNYGIDDFEGSKLNNPSAVGEQTNTLGWWYSTNNNEDPWQATTDFPYSRTEYSKLTGSLRRVSQPGDAHRMGSGHEMSNYIMPAGSELRYVFGDQHPLCLLAGDSYYDSGNLIQSQCGSTSYSPRYFKQITVNANGKETVTFTDRSGNQVAKAVSGNTSSTTVNLKNTEIEIPAGDYHDIHITRRSSSSTSVSFSGSSKNYTIYNLKTDGIHVANIGSNSYSLPAGFYRIVNNNSNSNLTVSYQINYFDFSLSIYDHRGNRVASVAPNDVDYDVNNPEPEAFTYYQYNSVGELIWERSVDGGRKNYFYSPDGRLRFTQDSKQTAYGRYSYLKYDKSKRVIEMGECSVIPSSGLGNYTGNDNYPYSSLSNRTYYLYDEVDAGFPLSSYEQRYVTGKLSKMWNDQESIWHSYDEMGRAEWVARQITGANEAKITEYQYDMIGNVTSVVYQKDKSDEFRHQYAYDRRSMLKSAATRRDDHVNSAPTNQAQYVYHDDGDLAEKVYRNGLETQNFAYTISGKLKAINPDDMRVTDIGEGGRHPFSMALHYYLNDFKPANGQWKETRSLPTTSATSTSYNSFNENVTASRWKTRATNGSVDLSGHFAYRYRYNYRDEFDWAYFANITPYSNSTYEGQASFNLNYYNWTTYDKNGNVKRMYRYGTNISGCSNGLYLDNLTFNYSSTAGSNRLTHIDDSYSNNCVPGELTDQNANNYVYNQLGQLIIDYQANRYIEYDVYERVAKVRNGTTSSSPLAAEYFYGPDGRRVRKKVYNGSNWVNTWYSYDANILQSTYENSNACGGCGILSQTEVPLYGSGRVGIAYPQSSWEEHYELSDHLGNVRAVIREGQASEQEVLSYADYYPYGWKMPERHFSASDDYRYAYQGQFAEEDEETGWLAFDLRSYDPRMARWMSMDPYHEFHSPYLAMANSPINYTDPSGGTTDSPIFDYDGNFLGTDSEGFKGDIIIMTRDQYMAATANGTKILDHELVMQWANNTPHTRTLTYAMLTDFNYDDPKHRSYLRTMYQNLLLAAADEGLITLSSDYFDKNPLQIVAATGRIAASGPNSGKWKITAYVNTYEKGEEPVFGGDYKYLWFIGDSGDAINILGVHEPLHEKYPGNHQHPTIDPIVLDPKQNPAIKLATPEYIQHVERRIERNKKK